MPTYNPPLRDMHFLLHEMFNVADELKLLPRHAEMDAETINAVLEEGGKFAAEVASRRHTTPMCKAAGPRWPATRRLVARACPWWSTTAFTRC
jgi:hypothetical protein